VRLRRRIANFLIKDCRLRKLHDSKPQKLIRGVLDEIDIQHIRDTYPCPSFQERGAMYRSMHELHLNGGALDYLEFGVFQGESMRQWVDLNKRKESRFFGFDSFEGLPEEWRDGHGKGYFDVRGAVPQIDDPRVQFIKGWFENTVPPFARDYLPKNRMLLHIDCDLYASAMVALVYFAPFMSKGTLLIFDEFYDRENEFKALMDWQRIFKKRYRLVAEMQNYGKICAEIV
jgi:O-methyltransferase